MTFRSGTNYTDNFNTEFGEEKGYDIERKARYQIDLHGAYQFTKNLSGFVQVQNLTEREIEHRIVGPDRLQEYETVPRVIWIGVRGQF
jgi:outer membrane receptor for ferric coprogen and ferric-rhodotorulic acid